MDAIGSQQLKAVRWVLILLGCVILAFSVKTYISLEPPGLDAAITPDMYRRLLSAFRAVAFVALPVLAVFMFMTAYLIRRYTTNLAG